MLTGHQRRNNGATGSRRHHLSTVADPSKSPPQRSDILVGIVFGVLGASNLVQGAWIGYVPWLNITAAGFVLALPIVLFSLGRRLSVAGLTAILLLFASLTLGLLASAIGSNAANKRVDLLITVVFVISASLFSLSNRKRLLAFLITTVLMGIIVVIAQVLNPDSAVLLSGRRTPEGLNSIGAGRVVGAALVILLALAVRARRGHLFTLLCLAVPLVVGLLWAESRGPLLGLGAACLFLLVRQSRSHMRSRVVLMVLLVTLTYLCYTWLLRSGSRLVTAGDSGRQILYVEALQIAVDHPTGIGWGNFYRYVPSSLLNSGQGDNLYVHNIVLEFLVECGAFGVILFLGFVLLVMREAWTASATDTGLAVAALAVNLFVGALFSSDVVGNRMMWVVFGAALGGISSAARTQTRLVRLRSSRSQMCAKPRTRRAHQSDAAEQ